MNSETNIGDAERIVSGVIGGALAIYGVRRGHLPGMLLLAAGGALVARAIAGRDPLLEAIGARSQDAESPPWSRKIHVQRAITIQKPRNEVYDYWRRFENLPKFMRHLEEVHEYDETRSRWVACAPAGKRVAWEAEITDERPDEVIAWRSLPSSEIETEGIVQFSDAPGGRGTEIRVRLTYAPPAGVIGAAVAKLFGEEPKGQIDDDLRRLRSLLEAGEAPTTKGQPSDQVRKAKGLLGVRLFGPSWNDASEPSQSENKAAMR